MELVKKNVVNIICGVVILIALVSLIWPTGSWYSDFDKDLQKRKTANSEVGSLLTTQREMPIGDIDGKPQPLDRFPSPPVIQQGTAFVDALHVQSMKLLNDAIRLNQQGHEVLVPGLLPQPSASLKSVFQRAYSEVTHPGGNPGRVLTAQPGNPVPENIPDGILNSTLAPTDAQITAALAEKWKKEYENLLVTQEIPAADGKGPPQVVQVNYPVVVGKFEADNKDFPQKFRLERAGKFKMYIEPDALTLSQKLDQGATPAVEDVWYAQLGLWVQQDIARAIRETNEKSKFVAASPIKHLLKIALKDGQAMYETAATNGNTPTAGVAAAPLGQVVSYTVSPSGRVCNQMYDVVQSRTEVVVDAEYVQPFLRVLEKNRLTNVLEVNECTVDSEGSRVLGYDYGARPVVLLRVRCEHLLMRDWTARGPGAPMPAAIQKWLGVEQPAPPAGNGEPANPVAER